MRVSHLFGDTLRKAPADVDIVSHQLLLRAGYIRQLAAGVFSYLPLGQRALRRVEQILREEIDAIGGQEINMPVVHPAEIWQETGRWQQIDDTMVRFEDRRGRPMLLAMTHEEVVADIARHEIKSYKQLPMLVYQIQTKFRDELRSRGGLIRVREFVMKDSYSLDRDVAGLEEQYVRHYDAYFRIGARAGLPLISVQSDTGMMGGKVAHEFMYVTDIGEDNLVLCDKCGYSANREVAQFVKPDPPAEEALPLQKVETPESKTVEEVASLLGIGLDRIAKLVYMVASYGEEKPDQLVACVVRGDMEVNLIKVQNMLGALELRVAEDEEMRAAGAEPGFASPIGNDDSVAVLVDDLVERSPNLVTGANEAGYHVKNSNVGRDYTPTQVDGIAAASEGAGCIRCGSPLSMVRGVEVGNIFQLGTRYTDSMNATYLDEHGKAQPIVMGSYGIGVGRLLACVAEEYHDDRGLIWPISLAPFAVNLITLGKEPETAERGEAVYRELQEAGIDVLFDERNLSPGVKLADADLRGCPIRVVVSARALQNGGHEMKLRRDKDATVVPVDTLIDTVRQRIATLQAELDAGLEELPTWADEASAG